MGSTTDRVNMSGVRNILRSVFVKEIQYAQSKVDIGLVGYTQELSVFKQAKLGLDSLAYDEERALVSRLCSPREEAAGKKLVLVAA